MNYKPLLKPFHREPQAGFAGMMAVLILAVAVFVSGYIMSFRLDTELFNADRRNTVIRTLEESIRYGLNCPVTEYFSVACDGVTPTFIFRWDDTPMIAGTAEGTIIGSPTNGIRLNAVCVLSGTTKFYIVRATWLDDGASKILFGPRALTCPEYL